MRLSPSEYRCPDHGNDLTKLVEEALEDTGGPPVRYRKPRAGHSIPFQVIVECPVGHLLTCTGTYTL
jgi:hypothetical protein